MGALVDVREELAALLTDKVVVDGYALPVIDHIPESFVPPALLIMPADDYVNTAGLPFGHATVSYELLAIYRAGTNPAIAAGVETLAEQVIGAVLGLSHWGLERVGKPVDMQFSTGTYPTVQCTVSRPAPITTD